MSTQDTRSTFSQVKADAFARTMLTTLNHGALSLMMSVGRRTGLFDVMSTLSPASSDDIVECFRNGGGVPYAKFPRFHEVMAEDSSQSVLSSLESHVVPLAPGLSERLTRGIRVLDLGCGSGRIANRLAADLSNFDRTAQGEGLGAMWGEEKTRGHLRAAGLRHVTTRQLDHDIQNNWYVVTK